MVTAAERTIPVGAPAPAGGITEPGVYDLTEAEYHADPVVGGSLSSSGARRLLALSCPAKFKWERDHPQPHRKTFDLGTAAHREVLGVGADIAVIEHEVWNTKAAKAEVAEARAAGLVPLKPAEHQQVLDMADAIRQHPIAGPLFTPGSGMAERALVWRDERTGVACRALVDWMTYRGPRLVIVDYKTTTSVEPADISKTVQTYGYNQQDRWYWDGVQAVGLGDESTEFLFVMQEKTAPYLVVVFGLDDNARLIGDAKNRRALHTYAECTRTGTWPGYADGQIPYLELPKWAAINDSEEYLND